MADPVKSAITVPAGKVFQLRWTIPHNVQSTASFVDTNGSQDFPDSKCKFMNGHKPVDGRPAGTAKVTLTVKKGTDPNALQPEIFKANRSAPTLTVAFGMKSVNHFAAPFRPGEEGVTLEFTCVVDIDAPKMKDTKTFITTVTVTEGDDINDKRQAMLDLFDKWMPTSILGQVYPKKFGDPAKYPNKDILDLANWSKDTPDWSFTEIDYDGNSTPHTGSGEGNQSFAKRQCNDRMDAANKAALDKWTAAGSSGPKPVSKPHQFTIVTSCGSVMGKVLQLWGCDFDNNGKMATREMSIADDYPPNSKNPSQPGAKTYGYWVDAAEACKKPADAGADWKPQYPKAGDIVVLWDDGQNIRAHVCMVVSADEDTWVTAEGGGGTIPDQTASKNNKDVTWKRIDADHPKGIPHILDVTSGKVERVTGWVDLDKVPNPNFDKDGKKK